MKEYWDHTEAERAALSRDEVEALGSYELMKAGVLRAGELVLVDEPEMPAPDREVWTIGDYRYSSNCAVYDSREDAICAAEEEAGTLAGKAFGEYPNQETIYYVNPLKTPAADRVRSVAVFSDNKRAALAEAIEQAAAARIENTRRKKAHEEMLRAQYEALRGMWSDWHECCAKRERMGRIARTFDEYVQMAGERRTAWAFLKKAFDHTEITDAVAWGAVENFDNMPKEVTHA